MSEHPAKQQAPSEPPQLASVTDIAKQKQDVLDAWGRAMGILAGVKELQDAIPRALETHVKVRECTDEHESGRECYACGKSDGRPGQVHDDWLRWTIEHLIQNTADLDPLLHFTSAGDLVSPGGRDLPSFAGREYRSAHEAVLYLGYRIEHVLIGEEPTDEWLILGTTGGRFRLPADWNRERSWQRICAGFERALGVAITDRSWWRSLEAKLKDERRDAERWLVLRPDHPHDSRGPRRPGARRRRRRKDTFDDRATNKLFAMVVEQAVLPYRADVARALAEYGRRQDLSDPKKTPSFCEAYSKLKKKFSPGVPIPPTRIKSLCSEVGTQIANTKTDLRVASRREGQRKSSSRRGNEH